MAKGTIGKQNVINKIKAAFGADFIGEYDKKIYVWTQENGERIQIALSLTCPKVQVLRTMRLLLWLRPVPSSLQTLPQRSVLESMI